MNNVLGEINHGLIEVFDNVMKVEALSVIKEYGGKLSMSEVHTIAAIGVEELKSMGEIAAKLHITVGTLTVAINNMVRKGFVERYKSERDRRIVKVGLTRQGKRIYEIHEKFHNELVMAMVKGLNEEEMQTVAKALTNIDEFVEKRYNKKVNS